jgi:hypothetical protein
MSVGTRPPDQLSSLLASHPAYGTRTSWPPLTRKTTTKPLAEAKQYATTLPLPGTSLGPAHAGRRQVLTRPHILAFWVFAMSFMTSENLVRPL